MALQNFLLATHLQVQNVVISLICPDHCIRTLELCTKFARRSGRSAESPDQISLSLWDVR
jgi:hypothetical protein